MTNTNTTCTRRLSFCAGHRVKGHEGKCSHFHGHQYEVEVEAAADALDEVGRVIDFSVIKNRIGSWIDKHWDHGFLLWEEDHAAIRCLFSFMGAAGGDRQKLSLLQANPTAENIAAHLLLIVAPAALAGTGVTVVRVTVHETPNCYATVRLA